MTLSTIYKIADELGREVEWKRYSYWNNILHIGNTAIGFFIQGNSMTFRHVDELDLPAWCTKEYIKRCITEGVEELGWINLNYKPFEYGSKKWNPAI